MEGGGIRARSVVQVHPGPPFKSPVNTRIFSLFPFPRIFLKKPICQLFANFRIGQRTQCREIHGVDLLVATVRPRFQPPPKARYSPTRLVVPAVWLCTTRSSFASRSRCASNTR